ncbi:hypothetical protein VPH35_008518 [Triticum aestivum]|uniref:Uncharacterized protein n=1 Tax=Triticum turgidum subsp. durum TaxID=4567 RepID=A0A9R0QWD7_TRITD|nr:unnamed protein product [Triticum turgidum subsp. durum]
MCMRQVIRNVSHFLTCNTVLAYFRCSKTQIIGKITHTTLFSFELWLPLIQAPVHFVYIVVRIVTICACSILINGIFSKHVWCGYVCNLAQREITKKYTFFQHDMVLKWDSTTKLKCVGISHCR